MRVECVSSACLSIELSREGGAVTGRAYRIVDVSGKRTCNALSLVCICMFPW